MLNISFIAEYSIGPYDVDFYVPSRNLIIEADGTYWHSRPETIERDAKRDTYLKGLGYVIFRIPQETLENEDSLVTCYYQLKVLIA